MKKTPLIKKDYRCIVQIDCTKTQKDTTIKVQSLSIIRKKLPFNFKISITILTTQNDKFDILNFESFFK